GVRQALRIPAGVSSSTESVSAGREPAPLCFRRAPGSDLRSNPAREGGTIQSGGQIFEWSLAVCSRRSSKAGGVGHVLSDFILPTRCGWVFDHSRGPDRPFGSHPPRVTDLTGTTFPASLAQCTTSSGPIKRSMGPSPPTEFAPGLSKA